MSSREKKDRCQKERGHLGRWRGWVAEHTVRGWLDEGKAECGGTEAGGLARVSDCWLLMASVYLVKEDER